MKPAMLFIFLLVGGLSNAQTKTYSIVFLNKKANQAEIPKEQLDKIMEGHMANINRLAKEGKLLAAGPFEGGGGLFVLATTSVEEAQEWLSTDPGVKAKRWDIEILPYTPRFGGVCAVHEPYAMTHYEFIRYDAAVSKFTANDYPQILARHDQYLKQLTATGNVVTEAIFGDRDGGILVIRGALEKAVIEADPGVQQGLMTVQFKQLWIAKGSFCEK